MYSSSSSTEVQVLVGVASVLVRLSCTGREMAAVVVVVVVPGIGWAG